jgi:hypothetical protein
MEDIENMERITLEELKLILLGLTAIEFIEKIKEASTKELKEKVKKDIGIGPDHILFKMLKEEGFGTANMELILKAKLLREKLEKTLINGVLSSMDENLTEKTEKMEQPGLFDFLKDPFARSWK